MSTLDELRRLHEAATPGPWGIDDGVEVDDRGNAHKVAPELLVPMNLDVERIDGRDAALIVAMRNALPALIAVAGAAQKALAWFDSQAPNGGGCCREDLREALRKLTQEPGAGKGAGA